MASECGRDAPKSWRSLRNFADSHVLRGVVIGPKGCPPEQGYFMLYCVQCAQYAQQHPAGLAKTCPARRPGFVLDKMGK
eukprot:1304451-Pyramimonas_sp.AAC.1